MKNINHQLCDNYCVLIDFIISVFTTLNEAENNIAFLIKNKTYRTLYSSTMYNSIISNNPSLESEIDKIIDQETTGYKIIEECIIRSYKLQDTDCSSKLFCFMIQDTAIPTKHISDVSRYYHDIQEPLRSISNFLQLLNKQPEIVNNVESAKYISYAMSNIEKLKGWSSELLLLPIQSSIIHKEEKEIKLQHIIKEVESLLLFQINSRNCSIDVESNMPAIICDKSSIISIFKNLIENSLNHAFTNGEDLRIKIYQDIEQIDRNYITIIYEDNGVSNYSINISNNHGIGMRIIAHMTKSINGQIQNISKDNGYNKFRIKLPITFDSYSVRRTSNG